MLDCQQPKNLLRALDPIPGCVPDAVSVGRPRPLSALCSFHASIVGLRPRPPAPTGARPQTMPYSHTAKATRSG